MLFIYGLVVGYHRINSETLQDTISVDFYEAMRHSKEFDQHFAEQNQHWQILKSLYETGLNREFTYDTLRIPKIAHLIWLGSKVPPRYKKLEESFLKLHPDWKIILWTDMEAAHFSLANHKAFNNARNFAEKSDIIRYEILYKYGGVYIDGDFEFRKPLDELHYACSLYVGIAYDHNAELYNGLIGCERRHPIIKECIKKIGTRGSKIDPEAIMNRTGPYHFTRCFFAKCFERPGVIAFPVAFFYPVPNYDRWAIRETKVKKYWKPYSYGIHYWACSWVPR